MKHCTNCGSPAADDAKFCGGCGQAFGGPAAGDAAAPSSDPNAAAPEPEKKKLSTAQGCGALFLIGALVYSVATCDSDKATTGAAASSSVPAAAPIDVTAEELFQAYQANEARAQQTYGESPLRVSGTIDSIDLDLTDDPVVMLSTSNQFMNVHAALADDAKSAAANLSKGQAVTLTCEKVGEVIGSPMLRDCRL